jgi:hypothetical protein
MPKDNILEELDKMAQDADQLGMKEASSMIASMAGSLRERYGRDSCQI